jgi:hypothetical protein
MKPILLLLAALLTAMSPCRADIILDGLPSFGVNIGLFAPTGQSFIADRSVLKSIGMWTTSCNCPDQPLEQFQLRLLSGSGTSGTPVATRTAMAPNGLYGFLDFDFSGVMLTVGQTYTAVMTQLSETPPGSPAGIYGSSNDYSGGMAFLSGVPQPDMQFSLRVIDDPLAANALQYSAKILCGLPDKQQAERGGGMAAYGMYFTAVNVHNPGTKEAFAEMKVAVTKADGQPGGVSSFHPIRLGDDEVIGIDCSAIRTLANEPTAFLDGFLVIKTDFNLDVVAVYTGAQNGQLATFGLERISGRKLNSPL